MRRRVREEEETGELNIIPYLDIVTNLVMFMLLSMAGIMSLGVLDVGTPKLGEPDPVQAAPETPQEPQLTLTVGVTPKGFYVAGAGGVIGGSEKGVDMAAEPTVPKKGLDYDYPSLTMMLATIKKQFPKEERVILVADSNIPYDVIIQTMDACREQMATAADGTLSRQKLFNEVWLSQMQ